MSSIEKKKMLYFMHVDWSWIKQRPHFLAEEMAKYYDVTVIFPRSVFRRGYVKGRDKRAFKLVRLPYLPGSSRILFVDSLNILCQRIFINRVIQSLKPSYVWISHPGVHDILPRKDSNWRLIYDCMDNYFAISFSRQHYYGRLKSAESRLVENASSIFVSSQNLATLLDDEFHCARKTVLVRNAFGGNLRRDVKFNYDGRESGAFRVCYIGTVGKWFDFASLHYCLSRNDNLEFHIIGPVETDLKRWAHPRIRLGGTVAHEMLEEVARGMDCMIMPFTVNELVKSVDPVKLYEYMNFGKPIVAVRYREIERFSKFVKLYSNEVELEEILRRIMNERGLPPYSNEDRVAFLNDNNWERRGEQIVNHLEGIPGC